MPVNQTRIINLAVGGPQGVGKTTTVRLIAQMQDKIQGVFVGERFPADFQSLPPTRRWEVRKAVSAGLIRELGLKDVSHAVDLHYLEIRESNPRLHSDDLLRLFDLHVLLNTNAATLTARRRGEGDRTDRPLDLETIDMDIAAHDKFFRSLLADGLNAVWIDATAPPTTVATAILALLDAASLDDGPAVAHLPPVVDVREVFAVAPASVEAENLAPGQQDVQSQR